MAAWISLMWLKITDGSFITDKQYIDLSLYNCPVHISRWLYCLFALPCNSLWYSRHICHLGKSYPLTEDFSLISLHERITHTYTEAKGKAQNRIQLCSLTRSLENDTALRERERERKRERQRERERERELEGREKEIDRGRV